MNSWNLMNKQTKPKLKKKKPFLDTEKLLKLFTICGLSVLKAAARVLITYSTRLSCCCCTTLCFYYKGIKKQTNKNYILLLLL